MVTPETGYIYNIYSQTWLKSHYLQHQPHYNNTHGRNGFSGLYKMSWLQQLGYNSTVPHISGTKGVVVNKFDCIRTYIYIHTYVYIYLGRWCGVNHSDKSWVCGDGDSEHTGHWMMSCPAWYTQCKPLMGCDSQVILVT